jgi:hypothetical protein
MYQPPRKSWPGRHPATSALIAAAVVVALIIVIINVATSIGKSINSGNPSPPATPQHPNPPFPTYFTPRVHGAVAPEAPSPPVHARVFGVSCGQPSAGSACRRPTAGDPEAPPGDPPKPLPG